MLYACLVLLKEFGKRIRCELFTRVERARGEDMHLNVC